jgi:hypothetical protein
MPEHRKDRIIRSATKPLLDLVPAAPVFPSQFIRSGASTNFSGGFLALQKRLSSGLEFTINSMYSHALADNIGEGGSISDPTNIHRDYGNANNDTRRNLVIQGIYQPIVSAHARRWLNGFELSSMTFMNSGYPINPIAGTDLNNDGDH